MYRSQDTKITILKLLQTLSYYQHVLSLGRSSYFISKCNIKCQSVKQRLTQRNFIYFSVIDSVGISGMLFIHLLAGRGLRATPEGTQPTTQTNVRDLYCVLECDRVHKARTVVRSGDLQFDWDESFELDLVCNKQLDVLVYSWDPQHRHKLCYRGAISLSTLLRQSNMHHLAVKV